MQKLSGILLFWIAFIANAFAADTNQVVQPALMQIWEDSFRSPVLSSGGWPPATVTNQPPWSGNIGVGLALSRGNSDTLLANTTFNAHRNDLTNELTFEGDGTYGEAQGVENADILHGFGQYNHLFTQRVYSYLRLEAWHDGIADVFYRAAFSPGVGYYIIKTRQTLLAAGLGPGLVTEKVDDERDQYMTLRLAERFEHKFNEHARCWDYAEILPEADKPDNFLINAEAGVETAITKNLSLQTVLDDNYANIPAPGRLDNDLRLVSGVVYKF